MHNKLAGFGVGFLTVAFSVSLLASLRGAEMPLVIGLETYGGSQKVIHAKINGREGVFLFDSGGGVSNITPEFAALICRKPWGRIVGFRMTGQRIDMARCDAVSLEIAGNPLHLSVIGIFDLMSLVPPGAPKLDGMIGLDAFANKTITIELANNRLIVETPESLTERAKAATEEPVRMVRDAQGVALTVDAAVKTANGTAWMELDTGNDGNIAVADWLAAEYGLEPGKKAAQAIKFQLANGIKGEGLGWSGDLIMDGNLGSQFLRSWLVTFDLSGGRAWFAPAPQMANSDR